MLDLGDSCSPSEIDWVLAEVMAKQERGEHIDVSALLAEHSNIADSLRSYFENARMFSEILGPRDQNQATPNENSTSEATEIELGNVDRGLTKADRAIADAGERAEKSEAMPIDAVRFGGMFGRYRIEKLLGDGGMGAVYLAQDTLLNRHVALKTPKFSSHDAARLIERFRLEAQAAAKLHHRNICPVHDVGRCEGIDYLTMAYIEGKPLSAYISSRRPLDQRQVALIIRRLALGMQAAHEAGVVHRDLKPSNVMIDLQGEPIVMDFGLASRIGVSDDSRLTAAGSIVGTPAYMSPEQVRGAKQEIGPQCDIYSLGVMFYEMLAGRLPFRGSTAEVMGKILVAKPPNLQQLRPDVDDQIASICDRMMSKSRKTRFASMKEVADELTEVIRRLRLDDPPKPPIVEGVESLQPPAGNTATELAAIAAEAASHARGSGKSWRDGSSDSQSGSVWRNGLAWLDDLPTSVRILVSIVLALIGAVLSLVVLDAMKGDEVATAADSSVVTDVPSLRGGDELVVPGPIGPPGADLPDFDSLKEIYQGLVIETPRVVEGPLQVGSPITISFDLTNAADVDFADPLVRAALEHSPDLGIVRLRIEIRGQSREIPGLEDFILQDFSGYLLREWPIDSSEVSEMQWWRRRYQYEIRTEAWSAGSYCCLVDYVSPDGEFSQQKVVDFQLTEAVAPSPPPPPPPPSAPEASEELTEEHEPAEVPPVLGVISDRVLGGERPKVGDGANRALPPSAWRVAPAGTQAMSFVTDLRVFSDNLDHAANVMRLSPPEVLQYGKAIANITSGLNERGTLMWLYGAPNAGRVPIAYLLPSLNHEQLIAGMQPKRRGKYKDVFAEDTKFKTIAMKRYSAFAEPDHIAWLEECGRENGGFDVTLGGLNDFLQRQDIGFAVTREFSKEGKVIKLPFAKGDYVIPASMSDVAEELFDFTGFQAVAGGTAILPKQGVRVSLAAAIDPGSDMGSWSKSMRLRRDDLVALLPSGPAALVLGVSSCDRWSSWLEQLLQEGCRVRFGEQGDPLAKLIKLDSLRGATLLVSANPDIATNQIAEQIHLQFHVDDAHRAMDGTYAFLESLAGELEDHVGALDSITQLKVGRVDHRGRSIVTLELVDTPVGGQARTFVFSIAPLNQNTLLIQGGDPDRFQSVYSWIAAGNLLHDDANTRAALKLISADSQQLILCNAGHASKVMNQFAEVAMPAFAGPPIEAPVVKPKEIAKPKVVDNPKVASNVVGNPSDSWSGGWGALTLFSQVFQRPRNAFADMLPGLVILAGSGSRVPDAKDFHHAVNGGVLIGQGLAGFRDVSPVCVGNHFQATHVELDVVATEDLLGQIGRLPPFAKEAAFEFLKQSVRDLYDDQFSP